MPVNTPTISSDLDMSICVEPKEFTQRTHFACDTEYTNSGSIKPVDVPNPFQGKFGCRVLSTEGFTPGYLSKPRMGLMEGSPG
jgi:hypothetical protein